MRFIIKLQKNGASQLIIRPARYDLGHEKISALFQHDQRAIDVNLIAIVSTVLKPFLFSLRISI